MDDSLNELIYFPVWPLPETAGKGGVGALIIMHGRSRTTIDPRIPKMPGTEHVGCSPTKQTLPGPSAKSREIFESHEGWAAFH